MKKICTEFNVDKNTDLRQKLDANGGLRPDFTSQLELRLTSSCFILS